MKWELELKESLRTAEDLHHFGLIKEEEIPRYRPVLEKYQFLLPRYYANLMDRRDPHCPIRLQAIPSLEELENPPGFTQDPLHDLKHQPASRITHRYANRALLHLTAMCSMYCRFCFRKTLLNELSGDLFSSSLSGALNYLREHQEIEEVIFSGGDPLMVSDLALADILRKLLELPHLRRLRFHTRVPVTFPVRITPALVEVLTAGHRPCVVVTHFNHPKEITRESSEACRLMREGGIYLLNQSVLLKGVNDRAKLLTELSQLLFEDGILPYYLHHPDRAQGTAYFDLPIETGLEIYDEMKRVLPGYLVPRYVIDTADQLCKMSVEEYYLRRLGAS